MSLVPKIIYSRARLAARLAVIGKQVSKDYAGRTIDVVIILEDAFIFAADLIAQRFPGPLFAILCGWKCGTWN